MTQSQLITAISSRSDKCCDMLLKCMNKYNKNSTMELTIGELIQFANEENIQICKEVLSMSNKTYLSAVIKPFRDNVESITKAYLKGCNKYYLIINLIVGGDATLPMFDSNEKMYENMIPDRDYTLEELGL